MEEAKGILKTKTQELEEVTKAKKKHSQNAKECRGKKETRAAL